MASVTLNLDKLVSSLNRSFIASMNAELPNIKEQHDREVPLDTGALKNSLEFRVLSDSHVRFVTSAEAPNGYNYAVKQHEDSTLKHDDGRKSHYLRDPIIAALNRLYGTSLRRR